MTDKEPHRMQVALPSGDLVMQWPQGLLARDLQALKDFVVLQLDHCIKRAEKKSYAEIEYASWGNKS